MHRLFEAPLGASEGIGFYVPTGIDPNEKENVPKLELASKCQSGFYVLNAKVTDIKKFGNQIAIVAKPTRTGYQQIWIKRKDIPKDKVLYHLVTSNGNKIDYLPVVPTM